MIARIARYLTVLGYTTCLLVAQGRLVYGGDNARTSSKHTPRSVEQSAAAHVHALGGKVMYDLANRVVVIHINGCWLTDSDLAKLTEVQSLSHVRELKLDHTSVGDKGLSYLRNWKNLEKLNLTMTRVSDAGMRHLAELPQLQSLSLHSTAVTDAGLEHVGKLNHLTSLDLEKTSVSHKGLKELRGLTKLKKLLLGRTKVSDAGLIHLSGLVHLQELALNDTPITDAGVAHLSHLSTLRELELEGTHVSDAGLRHFAELKSLVKLNLRYTKTTNAGLDRLASLPNLTWLWPSQPKLAAAGKSDISDLRQGVQRQLWIANAYGNDIHVYEVGSFDFLGRYVVGPNPHGISATADGRTVHVALEDFHGTGKLAWIDTRTGKITHRINVGHQPNELECTPDGKWIYVPCAQGNWWVVDGQSKRVVKKIHTGGRPHNTVVSHDGNRMYLAPLGQPRAVTIVDVRDSHRVIGEIPFRDTTRPAAISRDERYFFQNIDGLLGIQVASIPDRRVVRTVRNQIPHQHYDEWSRCHGLAVRPDQKEIWTCNVEHHLVHVHELTSGNFEEVATIPVPGRPYWLSMSPDSRYAFVSLRSKHEVAVIDCHGKGVIRYLKAGNAPKRTQVIDVPLS